MIRLFRQRQKYTLSEMLFMVAMLHKAMSEEEVANLTGRSTYAIRSKLKKVKRKMEQAGRRGLPFRSLKVKDLYSYFEEEFPPSSQVNDDMIRRINSFIEDLEKFKNDLDYNF